MTAPAAIRRPTGASRPSGGPTGARGGPWVSSRLLLGAAGVLAFLIGWELIGASGLVDARIISRPSLVLRGGVQLIASGALWPALRASGSAFTMGFTLAIIVGIPVGLAVGWYPTLTLMWEPTLMAVDSVPRSALLPLLFVWFGLGMKTITAVIFLGAVFPIIVNIMVGIKETDWVLIRAARSFGASQRVIFGKVILPSCLPYLMAGVRLGLGRALISIVVGEMYGGLAGIGALIMRFQAGLSVDRMLFLIILVAATGVALIQVLRWVEQRLAPWKREAV